MIDFSISPRQAQQIQRTFANSRQWLVQAVREGMMEAMQDLAVKASEAAPKRTGRLQTSIATSARVKETPELIVGTVSGDVGRKHVGLWLEYGIRDPEVTMRPGAFMWAEIEGKLVRFSHHRPFIVPGRPFMNPTLERDKPNIFSIIRRHVETAVKIQQYFTAGVPL